MLCPVCKAEYRPGFTHCSDCDVDLVNSLEAVPTNAPRQQDLEKPVLLWTGTSREAQSALCTALEQANIAYTHQEADVGIIPGLSQPVYAVFVNERDLSGAQFVLERVAQHFESSESEANTDQDSAAQPVQLAEEDVGDFGPVPDDIAGDFTAEDATEEIWSGDDAEMAETVRVCLRENGIGCVVDERVGERAVLVMPESGSRAKQIVGEIVRGTPMA